MASSKPVLHGRDHLPGHPDPIPGLADLIAENAALVHGEGRYQVDTGAVAVASNTTVTVDWEYVSGDVLLDLSAPDAPTVVQSGWYTIDITYSSTSGVWTEGSSYQCQLEFHGAQSKHAWSTVTIGQDGIVGGVLGGPRQGFVSLSGHLRAGSGDYIVFKLRNYDSISHDMTIDTAEVSMVYATTP